MSSRKGSVLKFLLRKTLHNLLLDLTLFSENWKMKEQIKLAAAFLELENERADKP